MEEQNRKDIEEIEDMKEIDDKDREKGIRYFLIWVVVNITLILLCLYHYSDIVRWTAE